MKTDKKKVTRPKTPNKDAGKAKKKIFAQEYIIDLNATQAAIRAGYSKKTAYAQGGRLLKDVEVQAIINELKADRSARVEVSSDDVLRELKNLAYADVRMIYDENGKMKPIQEWPDSMAACISSIESLEIRSAMTGEVTGVIQKVKLWDKTKCLDMLGRHLKMFGGEEGNKGGIIMMVKNADLLEGL